MNEIIFFPVCLWLAVSCCDGCWWGVTQDSRRVEVAKHWELSAGGCWIFSCGGERSCLLNTGIRWFLRVRLNVLLLMGSEMIPWVPQSLSAFWFRDPINVWQEGKSRCAIPYNPWVSSWGWNWIENGIYHSDGNLAVCFGIVTSCTASSPRKQAKRDARILEGLCYGLKIYLGLASWREGMHVIFHLWVWEHWQMVC